MRGPLTGGTEKSPERSLRLDVQGLPLQGLAVDGHEALDLGFTRTARVLR